MLKFSKYDRKMQEENKKTEKFKIAVGNVVKKIRIENTKLSLNQFSNEFEFDKGNLSKTERGIYNIYLMTAWKLAEASNVKFSDFAKLLENELGENFRFFDE